ncbi:MAG TPA: S9 family peptidase [Myxococcaceae bacterium]|nr:S9 family peptidase [Myxococcaceae bacterium]
MRILRFFALALLSCAGNTSRTPPPAAALPAPPPPSPATPATTLRQPPIARVEHKVITQAGDIRTDDYAWLRNRGSSEVEDYLKAENAYTDEAMAPTRPLQETLYRELLSHVQETDVSAPWRKGRFWYYARVEQGKQYPFYCRKQGNLDAPEQIMLDQNAMAEGKPFFAIGRWSVSDDGRYLAYLTDETGFRQYVLHVRDLDTGKDGPEAIPRVTSLAWAADGRTLFYVTEDATTKRPDTLWRHLRGATGTDARVSHEADERFTYEVERTRSGAYLLLGVGSHTTSEVLYLDARAPLSSWRTIAPRIAEQEYSVDHRGDRFYIRVNDTGRTFRMVTAPVRSPGRNGWHEEIPARPEVMLENIDAFADHLVLAERRGGLRHLRILDLGHGRGSREVEFPEPTYAVLPDRNEDFRAPAYRFAYESMVTPKSIYDVDFLTGARTLKKRLEIPGGFDPANYRTDYLHARASDGTEIPISLVYRAPLAKDGSRPLFVYGYGSYGYPIDASFSSNRLPLLDRGLVWAIAHVRGGGELGKPWHDAGRMQNKPNTFTDFIAATEWLQASGYGRKERTVAAGGSAGGLLMGAVANLRPDLFRIILAYVPFVDVLNTMSDASLPLTVGEYEEWGNPAKPAEYAVMRTYSPYDNVKSQAYPTMLVRTSYNDSQVMYWEPAKWVARLRATKTDHNLLLLKTKLDPAGHGGASGRYDRLRDDAFDQAFVLTQLGLASQSSSTER